LHDGKGWLIERYAVAVTPGLRLMEPAPIRRGGVQVLLNGLSEPMEKGFERLPFVKSEVETIGKLYPSRTLVDEAFVIPTVRKELDPEKSRPYTIVHIASHGQFSSDPGKTFVLTHDGRLTLNDLEALIRPREMNFGEPLELLTLSACETAAGDDRAALGLAGVAIKAGARSALATLWSVNDEAAQEVITDFYRRLSQEAGITKAKALQGAQKRLLAKEGYGDPYYWSPFLMIGNWL
jgi:CHAT domain-containing protein